MTNNLHQITEINLDKTTCFDNAVFYCMNASCDKVPVGIINTVQVLPGNILEFTLTHFPVMEQSWNVFAGELYFYKKGLPFSMTVHGTAWFLDKDDLKVQLRALHIENFGQPETKQYTFHETVADFFSNTSVFFKRMLVTGF